MGDMFFGLKNASTEGLRLEAEILKRARTMGEKALSGSGADSILEAHRKVCGEHAEVTPLEVEDDSRLAMLRERLKLAKFSLSDMQRRFDAESPNDVFTVAKAVRAKALSEAQDRVSSLVRSIRKAEASRRAEEDVTG